MIAEMFMKIFSAALIIGNENQINVRYHLTTAKIVFYKNAKGNKYQ